MPKPIGVDSQAAIRARKKVEFPPNEVQLDEATLPAAPAPDADPTLESKGPDLSVSSFGPALRGYSSLGLSDEKTPVPTAGSHSGASNVFNLQLARAGKLPAPSPQPVSRSQALADVLADAAALGVEIRSGQEADDYLNFAAKATGMPPEAMQAATLGADLVFVRDEVADDPRVLREEIIHTQQQAEGIDCGLSSTANAEVEARELMIANHAKWGITDDEVAEMKNDIKLIQERGRY